MSEDQYEGQLSPRVAAIVEMGAQVSHKDRWEGTPGVDRRRILLRDTVDAVSLPLDPEDWCQLAMREGSAYVGGCCGNMSQLQDVINDVFRGGGMADADELLLIGEAARGHDGFEFFEPVDDQRFFELIEEWKKTQQDVGKTYSQLLGEECPDYMREQRVRIDPWFKLGVVYNAVEPLLTPSSAHVPGNRGHRSEEKHLVHVVQDTLSRMSWSDMFSRDNEDDQAQHQAARTVLKARLLPALRRLEAELVASGVEMEGYAIINPADGEVLSDQQGLCLFPLREQAQRKLDLWERWAAEERKRRAARAAERSEDSYDEDEEEEPYFWNARKAQIVPARVTLEDGLVLER